MREEIVMEEQTVIHSTFVIERSFARSPERVFSAFADATKKRRWYAERETNAVEEFTSDFRVGGAERLRCRMKEGTPFPGVVLANEGSYLDIVPDRRIVSVSTMTLGDRHISSSLITVELLPTDKGTDLIFTHQGAFFEGSGGPQMREEGWRTLLDELTAELSR
jgi:uncharacterized protein YndB with AHSA1/START domain